MMPPDAKLHIDVQVYFWTANSIALIYITFLMQVQYCFDNSTSSVSFEIGKMWVLQLWIFFKVALPFLGPCLSVWILESACYFTYKSQLGVDRGCIVYFPFYRYNFFKVYFLIHVHKVYCSETFFSLSDSVRFWYHIHVGLIKLVGKYATSSTFWPIQLTVFLILNI